MHRWMQSAAGGTSQRLKPAFAMVCSRSRIPSPPRDTAPALSSVAIRPSPTAAHAGRICRVHDPLILSSLTPCKHLPCCFAPFRDAPGSRRAFEIPTPVRTGYALRRCPTWVLPRIACHDYRRKSALRPTERSAIGAEAAYVVDKQMVARLSAFPPCAVQQAKGTCPDFVPATQVTNYSPFRSGHLIFQS